MKSYRTFEVKLEGEKALVDLKGERVKYIVGEKCKRLIRHCNNCKISISRPLELELYIGEMNLINRVD